MDRSFSMSGEKLNLARQAARLFVTALAARRRGHGAGGGERDRDDHTASPGPGGRGDEVGRDPTVGHRRRLYDVIVKSLDMPYTKTRRRALLAISDGFDRYSDTTAADVIDRARRSDVLVYPVAIGKGRPPVLAELASVTGGHSFNVDDPKKLEATLSTIARELRSQYLLGYAPARTPASESEWRSIDVQINRPGARVRARDGYYSNVESSRSS